MAGYIKVFFPGHHRGDDRGYVWEHLVVAEKALGRSIRADEEVHHINGQRDDNRPENLVVLPGSEHRRLHRAISIFGIFPKLSRSAQEEVIHALGVPGFEWVAKAIAA